MVLLIYCPTMLDFLRAVKKFVTLNASSNYSFVIAFYCFTPLLLLFSFPAYKEELERKRKIYEKEQEVGCFLFLFISFNGYNDSASNHF